MIRIVKLAIVLIAFTGISCNGFLEVKPTNNVTVPRDIRDLQALLDAQTFMNDRMSPALSQILCDDYHTLPARLSLLDPELRKMYTWQSFDIDFPNDWSTSAGPIFNSNFCLDMIADMERTEDNRSSWDNVYGSALFFRSFYFVNLLWAYVPAYNGEGSKTVQGIPMRLTSDFNATSQVISVFDGYQQVIRDLEESLLYLPGRSILPTRPSKLAAHALLARIFLSMREYASALAHANDALAIYDGLMDYNNPQDVKVGTTAPFPKFTKETIFYASMANNGLMTMHSPNLSLVSEDLIQLYEREDQRLAAWFMNVSGGKRFIGSYSNAYTHIFSGLTTSELYLIRSECFARTGKVQEAMDDLLALLQSRYKTGAAVQLRTNATELLDRILMERRKELIYRGIRWSDIKRLNLEGYNIVLERELLGERHVLMPNSDQYRISLPRDLRDYFK